VDGRVVSSGSSQFIETGRGKKAAWNLGRWSAQSVQSTRIFLSKIQNFPILKKYQIEYLKDIFYQNLRARGTLFAGKFFAGRFYAGRFFARIILRYDISSLRQFFAE
jgi:hypothetical protein